jgi:hypothetical protein
MSNPIVELYPWEYERGFQVGIARFTANWGRADAPHYDRSRMEEDRKAQAASVMCEIAVARYTNQYFHGHVWHYSERNKYRHLADVGRCLEVRRLRTATGVPVRKSDAGKIVWGARIVDNEYRKVELLGCVEADAVIATMDQEDTWTYHPVEKLERPWTKGSKKSTATFEKRVSQTERTNQQQPKSWQRRFNDGKQYAANPPRKNHAEETGSHKGGRQNRNNRNP